jgi:drug/metabolite transporter (DMT)-like permease
MVDEPAGPTAQAPKPPLSDMSDTMKAALMEELRFAKRQQWHIAAAAVALLGATFAISTGMDRPLEKVVATVLVTLVAAIGAAFLWSLQKHLHRVRTQLNPKDEKAWRGTVSVMGVLIGVLAVSALVVLYWLWRDWLWRC